MAKLNPKDPQYGIPVSARIREELAHAFNANAAKANKTLSRHVSEFIENALTQESKIQELSVQIEKAEQKNFAQEKKLTELSAQIEKQHAIYKNAVGNFILEITENNSQKATQFIQTYNTILQNEKRN